MTGQTDTPRNNPNRDSRSTFGGRVPPAPAPPSTCRSASCPTTRHDPAGAGRPRPHRRPGAVCLGRVHGDEVLGIEIIRRVLQHRALKRSGHADGDPHRQRAGLHQPFALPARPARSQPQLSRLRPRLAGRHDRRSVPARSGQRSDFGIDLHTAALHRTNLPQIRILA